jgi:hypothetical protein
MLVSLFMLRKHRGVKGSLRLLPTQYWYPQCGLTGSPPRRAAARATPSAPSAVEFFLSAEEQR